MIKKEEQIQESAKLNRIMMDFSRYLWNKGYVNFGKVDYSKMLIYGDEFMKEHGKSYLSQQLPDKGVDVEIIENNYYWVKAFKNSEYEPAKARKRGTDKLWFCFTNGSVIEALKANSFTCLSKQLSNKGLDELRKKWREEHDHENQPICGAWTDDEIFNWFATYLNTGKSEEIDAVEFAEWAATRYTKGQGWGDKWMCNTSKSQVIFTTEQLYTEFKNSKGINKQNKQ